MKQKNDLNVAMIKTEKISPNPNQPRRRFDEEGIVRLADSISRHGILQPLCVRIVGRRPCTGYQLISGERRLRAARLIGMEYVPCLVMEGVDDKASGWLAVVENMQREELNIFDEAAAMERLMNNWGLSQEELCAVLSISQGNLSNKLRLLRLSPAQRSAVLEYSLSARHARAALRVKDESFRTIMLSFVGMKGMSVRETEELVEEYLADPIPVMKRLIAPPEPEQKTAAVKPIRKFVVKDVRIFINSVDKALKMIKDSGISVDANKTESESAVEYTIKVPKVIA